MQWTRIQSRQIRQALAKPAAFGIEAFVLLLIFGLLAAAITVGRQVSAPLQEKVFISLSFWSLPKYTLLSLGRGFLAYALSLTFTLVYGTIAAHNHRAEKIMLPVLDVLQAIPVLGFLPALVIAMIALFPTREIGLEIACVVMIFTAQAWNMTFSFHGSLRSIPPALREVAGVQRLSNWQIFRLLEVPAAMVGLVWNSMMSMAGGWFFLMVNEAFTLRNKDYRLPGIGSYMNEAVNKSNTPAVLAAIVAMVLMIVVVDQLFWRPIVVWSQRFRLEDSAGGDVATSWLLDLLRRSRLYTWAKSRLAGAGSRRQTPVVSTGPKREPTGAAAFLVVVFRWLVMGALLVLCLGGVYQLGKLLLGLPIYEHGKPQDWVHVLLALLASFARTAAAVTLAGLWTLPAGIMIGLSPKWSQRLQPIIQIVASFPAPMVFPLVTIALLVLHVPFTIGCVALMLLGAQWYILFNVIAGASAIPADLKEVASVYHMSRWQVWRRVYLPSVFPYLLTGLVTATGGAWNSTIVAEYLVVQGRTHSAFGLGSLISHATNDGNYPLLTAAVVTMAVFVVMFNRLVWKRLYRLAENRYSLNA